MKAASLINSLKNVQEQANSSPVMTLTDVRASAVSALGKARIQTNALLAWGGWSSNMLRVNKILENISLLKVIISLIVIVLQHYWRTDLDFRHSIQDKLTQ